MKPSAVFKKSITRLEDLPEDELPQVALVGRSNVGKSSLINHLTGQHGLARTSSSPGLTSTINFFEVGRMYYLVDLPGYGFASKSKEKKAFFLSLITDYLQRAEHLKLVLLIVDANVGLTELDEKMAAFLAGAKLPFAFVLNKADKLKQGMMLKLERGLETAYPGTKRFRHSTEEKECRGPIIAEIERVI